MRYVVSLRVFHSHLAPSEIEAALGMEAAGAQTAGELWRTPKGRVTGTVARQTVVRFALPDADGQPLEDYIADRLAALLPRRTQIRRLVEDDARIDFFVGVFLDGNDGLEFKASLMASLGDLGIDLDLDIYPPDSPTDPDAVAGGPPGD